MTEDHDPNTILLLGEIRGQLRELIHNSNNNAMKLDALGLRVGALEQDMNRREGASNVFQGFLKSPAVAWIVSAAVTVWALLSGRVNP